VLSERHAELIGELEAAASDEWGPRALLACLCKLRDGGPTEADSVVVHDVWATEDGFRVVYEPLGRWLDHLDVDADGLGWWGHVPMRRAERRR
jgi:hypothetical protein